MQQKWTRYAFGLTAASDSTAVSDSTAMELVALDGSVQPDFPVQLYHGSSIANFLSSDSRHKPAGTGRIRSSCLPGCEKSRIRHAVSACAGYEVSCHDLEDTFTRFVTEVSSSRALSMTVHGNHTALLWGGLYACTGKIPDACCCWLTSWRS